MPETTYLNPAEHAAQEALDHMFRCIDERTSFVFEAGAGAGKTYSLNKSLQKIIATQGRELLRRNQRIACITYTNVAKDEIDKNTDHHPVLLSATIHSFCWSLIKDFQPSLRMLIPTISDKWSERINDAGGVNSQFVNYDLGYPKVDENEILLHHDDVPVLMAKLMEEPKFRAIFSNRYPIIFVDEYQDTNKAFADSLIQQFVDTGNGPLIGFFGDHWQKIYGSSSCGIIQNTNLEVIKKGANFRSVSTIVDCLNKMRPELPQVESDPDAVGSIGIYHTNNWQGIRRKEPHWKDDLPSEVAHQYLETLEENLISDGWIFSPEKTKILMLTHNVLADEQGYPNLLNIFASNDSIIKKEDPHFSFFADIVEPVCLAYENRRFGEMFAVLDRRTLAIRSHLDKNRWAEDMNTLLHLRKFKDGEGNYLWKAGISSDRPDTILDFPVHESEYMSNTFSAMVRREELGVNRDEKSERYGTSLDVSYKLRETIRSTFRISVDYNHDRVEEGADYISISGSLMVRGEFK